MGCAGRSPSNASSSSYGPIWATIHILDVCLLQCLLTFSARPTVKRDRRTNAWDISVDKAPVETDVFARIAAKLVLPLFTDVFWDTCVSEVGATKEELRREAIGKQLGYGNLMKVSRHRGSTSSFTVMYEIPHLRNSSPSRGRGRRAFPSALLPLDSILPAAFFLARTKD